MLPGACQALLSPQNLLLKAGMCCAVPCHAMGSQCFPSLRVAGHGEGGRGCPGHRYKGSECVLAIMLGGCWGVGACRQWE